MRFRKCYRFQEVQTSVTVCRSLSERNESIFLSRCTGMLLIKSTLRSALKPWTDMRLMKEKKTKNPREDQRST